MTGGAPGESGTDAGTADHVRRNRASWDAESDEYQRRHRPQLNRWDRFGWGIWDVPEDEIGALGLVRDRDVLEFGCGAAQSGIQVAMRGARVVGLDFSSVQLGHAIRNMTETGVRFPLVQASGEATPFRDASFDLVFCDHGLMGFADPRRTVPEAARILRRGGELVFNISTPIIWLTWGTGDEVPADDRLRGHYFDLGRVDLADPEGHTTEFQLGYGEWIRLFRRNGLVVEDLIELRPPAEGASTTYDEYVSFEWSRRFPAEHIWKVRKGD